MADATIKGLTASAAASAADGRGLRVLVVHARWNATVVSALVRGCTTTLAARGVAPQDITVREVPGSFELPGAVARLLSAARAAGRPFDAAVAVGVLIKGDTMHFEYIAGAVADGLMRVGLENTDAPVVFGVLTVLTEEQALLRAGLQEGGHNHGEDWGHAAVEMANLYRNA
ncbi:hypothetical protein HK405_007131 [Cladochytrium tenue]|nr:hypothetical protein HK405_007131 [Cladochytrium tenue]